MVRLVSELRNPQQSVRILWMLAVTYLLGVGWSLFQLSTPLLQSDPRPLRFILLFGLLASAHVWGARYLSRRK
jgi:hypothetical protein